MAMANTIRLVEYFYLTASDKPGEAVRAPNILMSDGKSDLYLLRLQKDV
jgi:hypothetical protein